MYSGKILGISQELVVATQREDSNTSGESLSDVDLQGAGLGRGVLQVLHGSLCVASYPKKIVLSSKKIEARTWPKYMLKPLNSVESGQRMRFLGLV